MEWLIVMALMGVIQALGRLAQARMHERKDSLCLACTHAIVTQGRRGQLMVACNLQGAMRPVKFAVCQCSGFRVNGSGTQLVTIEGFAPERHEVYEEVAIR